MTARLDICVFGTFDERAHPRVRVLREGLVERGHVVRLCNARLGLDTDRRIQMAETPWRAPALAARILFAWLVLLWRSRDIREPDVVIVGYLGHFDVHLARRRYPRATIVLDHLVSLADTASDRRVGSDRLVLRLLAAIDRSAVRRSDLVVCDTDEQAAMVDCDPSQLVVVPVGAHEAWFAAGESAITHLDTVPVGPLRVVFFGLFTPLQGAPVIGSAVALLAQSAVDCTFTFIGRGQDDAATFAAMGDAGNVTRISWIDADDLPAVVASHDVCLGVFGTTPKARRVVPNKVYQGAAAGTVVITGDTPVQREALADFGVLVPPGRPDRLAGAIADLAADPSAARHVRKRTAAAARERFSPAAVVEPLLARLVPT